MTRQGTSAIGDIPDTIETCCSCCEALHFHKCNPQLRISAADLRIPYLDGGDGMYAAGATRQRGHSVSASNTLRDPSAKAANTSDESHEKAAAVMAADRGPWSRGTHCKHRQSNGSRNGRGEPTLSLCIPRSSHQTGRTMLEVIQ